MDNTSPLCQPIEAIFQFRGNCAKGKKTSARVQPQVLCILCSPCALLEQFEHVGIVWRCFTSPRRFPSQVSVPSWGGDWVWRPLRKWRQPVDFQNLLGPEASTCLTGVLLRSSTVFVPCSQDGYYIYTHPWYRFSHPKWSIYWSSKFLWPPWRCWMQMQFHTTETAKTAVTQRRPRVRVPRTSRRARARSARTTMIEICRDIVATATLMIYHY